VCTPGVTALYQHIQNPEPVLCHCLSQTMQWIKELPLNTYATKVWQNHEAVFNDTFDKGAAPKSKVGINVTVC